VGIAALFAPNFATTREARAKRLHLTNRPVTLLSGLLTCGCCGGRISMVMTNRYACRNHLRKGATMAAPSGATRSRRACWRA